MDTAKYPKAEILLYELLCFLELLKPRLIDMWFTHVGGDELDTIDFVVVSLASTSFISSSPPLCWTNQSVSTVVHHLYACITLIINLPWSL